MIALYVARRRLHRLLAAAGAATATAVVALTVASPAALAATCPRVTTSTPFAGFGDTNGYYLLPGANFESPLVGWTLSNASVVSGNEPYYLGSTSDGHSLKISSSAKSPSICITPSDPLFRFVARSALSPGSNGNYSQLNVSATLTNASGSVYNVYLGTLTAPSTSSWFVTPQFTWGNSLSSWIFATDGTARLQLQFTVQGQGGVWYVDDAYVDPFAGR